MHATLVKVEFAADNAKTFWFEPEGRLRYIAGQFIELYLPHANHDSRGERRWFTLFSSPTEDLLAITTKFAASDGSSFKKMLAALPLGAKVILSEPMGDFVLPKDTSVPLVFVAVGIGATPLRSITKWLSDNNERRTATLLYGARRRQALIATNLFKEYYGAHFRPFISSPLSATDIAAAAHKPGSLVYLSGPEPIIQGFTDVLRQSGVAGHQIITDFFPGYPA